MSGNILQDAFYTPMFMLNSGWLQFIVDLAVDMISHPRKYFEHRLERIEAKIFDLTVIVSEDCIRP